MKEIPPVSSKLKALQDTIGARIERQQKAREKVLQNSAVKVTKIEPYRQKYVPTIEDEYLMAQFENGRYCGD